MGNRLMMTRVLPLKMTALLWAVIYFGGAGHALADRREMQIYDRGGANQAIFSIERGSCGEFVDIEVNALSAHLYDFDRDDLFAIAGKIAQVYSFECGQVKKYRIAGYINGRLVFAGAIISDDWSNIQTSIALP